MQREHSSRNTGSLRKMPPTLRKRPARSKATSGPAKRLKTRNKQELEPTEYFPFLKLPAELRNTVYEYVVHDAGAVLRPKGYGRLASRSAICRVSRQVHDEYLSVVYVSAPEIRAYVTNFNFAHIIKFLNQLSNRELSALPTLNIPSERRLLIDIDVTETCPANPEELHRWLLRCEHPTKKGTNINASYVVRGVRVIPRIHRSIFMNLTLAFHHPPNLNPQSPVGRVHTSVTHAMGQIPAGRLLTEMEKIRDALRGGPEA